MKSLFFAASFFLALASSSLFAQSAASDSAGVTDISNVSLNQDNPTVSINRKNKNVIVIGAASDDMDANGMIAYTSTDQGTSWSSSRLPLPIDPNFYIYGEPSIAANDAGTFYYAYITNDGVDSGGNISIATSSNGKNWTNSTPIITNGVNFGSPDRVFITVDNSPESFHYNRVYAVWNQYYKADSLFLKEGLYITWSDNDGHTWTNPKFLGPGDDYQICRTGKKGEIYVSCSDSSGFGHELFVSTDFGTTFTSPALSISSSFFKSYPFFTFGLDSGYTGLKGSQGFRAFPYVAFDVDLRTGRLHAVTGDYEGSLADLYYSYSDNNGTGWSTPQLVGITVQDITSSDCFDPWVTVDQKTGEANVLFYSSEPDPKNILTATARVRLKDTIEGQPQILNSTFNPLVVEKTDSSTSYIGDRTMSDAFDSVYVGVWTQNRAGFIDGDVFAFISYPKSAKSSVQVPIVIHSTTLWLSSPYPNPSDGKSIFLSYYIPHATHLALDLFDDVGKQVKHLCDKSISDEGTFTEEFSLSNLPAGSYIIRMLTDAGQISRKLVVLGK